MALAGGIVFVGTRRGPDHGAGGAKNSGGGNGFVNPQMDPRFNSKADPRFNSQAEPRFNSKADPRFNPQGDPCGIFGSCRR